MAGRRPNTAQVNKLHDTRDAVSQNQVTVSEGAPDKPVGLSEIASEEWNYLVAELTDLGILSTADRAVIEMCARYAAFFHEAAEDVRENGLTVLTKTGTKANPSIRARDDAARIRKSYLDALGLTPASRSRVSKVTDSDDVDELEAILNAQPDPDTKPVRLDEHGHFVSDKSDETSS